MTVKELKIILEGFDENMIVLVDTEGHPLPIEDLENVDGEVVIKG